MVIFVADADRQKFGRFKIEPITVSVLRADTDPGRALYIPVLTRAGEASFHEKCRAFSLVDLRIDEFEFPVFITYVHHKYTAQDPDLDRRDTDTAVIVVHGLSHIIEKLCQFLIELFHGTGLLPKDRISIHDDFT